MSKKETVNTIAIRNGQIKQIKVERNALSIKNSLGSMVDNIQMQSNLTSFNPLYRNAIFAPLTLEYTLLTYLYTSQPILQAAIDLPVEDALRGWIEPHSDQLSPEQVQEVLDFQEEMDIPGMVEEAQCWTSLYGGGGLIVNVKQRPEVPLAKMKFDTLEFYPVSRWELLTPSAWKPDTITPWALGGASFDSEFFMFYGTKIHKSRVILMTGKAAPYQVRWQIQGWGMSEYERMVEDYNKYTRTEEVIYELLREAKVDVFGFNNLGTMLKSAAGQQIIEERVQRMNQLKSFMNAVIMDKEDMYEQKTNSALGGLSDVRKENRIGIACAIRIPMAKLFGLSAAGFNSGEDDIENYNMRIESSYRRKLRRPIREIWNLCTMHLFGAEYDFRFNFKPLREMTTTEEEAVKTQRQERALRLFSLGLVDGPELGAMLDKDKLLNIPTRLASGELDPEITQPMGQEGEEGDGEEDGGDQNSPDKKEGKGDA